MAGSVTDKQLLHELRRQGVATSASLAGEFEIGAAAVSHRLRGLIMDGAVAARSLSGTVIWMPKDVSDHLAGLDVNPDVWDRDVLRVSAGEKQVIEAARNAGESYTTDEIADSEDVRVSRRRVYDILNSFASDGFVTNRGDSFRAEWSDTGLSRVGDEYVLKTESWRTEWESIRQEVLDAAGDQCAECGATGNIHIHHTDPLVEVTFEAGETDLDRLEPLCAACHGARTKSV